ncbi:hypothetical protein Fmac_005900 [Flemingia macrophylla]|uniref:CLAVATA3/ESR (CLE)-related protein 9 n=1 Tax=Flemingia macrophylla TaxID=520843 RepID=A0ABD1NBV8_9FABA
MSPSSSLSFSHHFLTPLFLHNPSAASSPMKTPLSSLAILTFLFIFFLSSANSTPLPSTTSHLDNHYCDSFPHTKPRSLCIGLQRMHHNLHPLPPQLAPRFGAEKRRVPTGPNPLHN